MKRTDLRSRRQASIEMAVTFQDCPYLPGPVECA
jgi:hypothetical protein